MKLMKSYLILAQTDVFDTSGFLGQLPAIIIIAADCQSITTHVRQF